MKRVASILLGLFIFAGAGFAQSSVALDIHYASKNHLDIALYSFEENFLHAFPEVTFLYGKTNSAALKAIRLDIGCIENGQLILDGHAYNMFTARIKGKISVLQSDGTLLYSKDLEVVMELGSSAVKAEIAALKQTRAVIAVMLEKEKAKIEPLLK